MGTVISLKHTRLGSSRHAKGSLDFGKAECMMLQEQVLHKGQNCCLHTIMGIHGERNANAEKLVEV